MAVFRLTPASLHVGSVEIVRTFQSVTQSAPCCHGYEAASWSGFATAGPSGAEPYDARRSDIEHYWSVADAYDYVAPLRLPKAEFFNSGLAYGPKITQTWRSGGSKTIELFVYERSTGRTGVATFVDNIGNEDDDYPTSQTHHVDTTGVHTNAPAGATLHTTFDAAWAAVATGNVGTNMRIQLERGQSHTASSLGQLGLNANRKNVLVTAVGTGTIPTVDTSASQIEFGQGFGITATLEVDLKIQNVRFVGDLDPTNWAGVADEGSDCITTHEYPPKQLLLDNVEIAGHSIGVVTKSNTTRISEPYICVNDTTITDFRAAGLYGDSSWSVTGCNIKHNPNSMAHSGVGVDWVGAGRFPSSPYVYTCANDTFTRQGWSGWTSGNQYDLQGGWRFCTNAAYGAFVSHNNNFHEGGITAFSFNNVDGAVSTPIQAICQNNVSVGYSDSFNMVDSDFSGITLANNMHIQGGVTAQSNTFYGFVILRERTVNAENRAAPVNLIDNTFVCLKTTAQQASFAPVPHVENNPGYTVNETGSRDFQPYRGGGALGGVSTAQAWAAEYLGYRDHIQTTMQTQYATPSSELATYDHVFMSNAA